MEAPLLCLVTDRRLLPEGGLSRAVAEAVAGSVGMVQLREKDLSGAALLALAQELREVLDRVAPGGPRRERAGVRVPLVVNSNLAVALEAGADGLHLPEGGMAISQARRQAGSRFLIGRSVHSLDAALRAQEEGADYLIAGTVFATASHPGKAPEGLDLLRRIAASVRIPFLGIGGITAANVRQVMQAGADGAAVISAILAAPDPRLAAQAMANALRAAQAGAVTQVR